MVGLVFLHHFYHHLYKDITFATLHFEGNSEVNNDRLETYMQVDNIMMEAADAHIINASTFIVRKMTDLIKNKIR